MSGCPEGLGAQRFWPRQMQHLMPASRCVHALGHPGDDIPSQRRTAANSFSTVAYHCGGRHVASLEASYANFCAHLGVVLLHHVL